MIRRRSFQSRALSRRGNVLIGLLSLVAPTLPLSAQPVVFQGGIVNAASFLPPSVPGGAVAQGSIFTIFGEGFGSTAQQSSFPLSTTFNDVRVEVVTGDGQVFDAIPLFVSAGQINAILPSGVPVGEHVLRVYRNGVASAAERIKVVRSSIGIFTAPGSGFDFSVGGQPLISVSPGGRMTVWATGLGPVAHADSVAPTAADLDVDLEVFVGGEPAEILYQGRSGCCAALDQIELTLNAATPAGCFVPVWTTVGGTLHSNVAVVSVAAEGNECRDSAEMLSPPVITAPTGRVLLERATDHGPSLTNVRNGALAQFAQPEDGGTAYNPFGAFDFARLPPPGTCAPRQRAGSAPAPHPLATPENGLPNSLPVPVDAGSSFSLTTPAGPSELNASLGPLRPFPLSPDPPLNLLPGLYSIEGSGGMGFPAFTADLQLKSSPVWTNRETLAEFPREEIEPRWQGGDPAAEQLVSVETDCTSTGGFGPCLVDGVVDTFPSFFRPSQFVCRARPGATQFRIPDAFTANLPAGRRRVRVSSVPEPAEMMFMTDGPETGLMMIRDSESTVLDLGTPRLPSSPVTLPDGSRIQAELATNGRETQRGLMFRPSLGAGEGMLFLFGSEGLWRFWMLNTLIPLDIIWMNSNREIIFINADTPTCAAQPCPTYGPNARSQFVLELRAGEAARRGLRVGDRLDW